MINLTPKEEKKKIIKAFYYKLVVLFLWVLGSAVFIAFIGVLPSYILSSVRNNIINAKLETQKNEVVPLPDQTTVQTIKDVNNKLGIIEHAENKNSSFSGRVINSIITNKLSNIQITSISYLNDPTTGEKITIQGTAPSREVLLSFRLALEQDKSFKQVDLPISNFVQDSNIQFYLNLIPA
jgi:hypothetical protein